MPTQKEFGVIMQEPVTTSLYGNDFLDVLRRPPTSFDDAVKRKFKSPNTIEEERITKMVLVYWSSSSIETWHFLEDLEVLSH
jgi:hypothetical protein